MKRSAAQDSSSADSTVVPAAGTTVERFRACVCVSGSVAAVKTPELVRALLQRGVSVDLVLTDAAHSLLRASYQSSIPLAQLERLEHQCKAQAKLVQHAPTLNVYRDADEWAAYETVGVDTVLHVELAKRSQLLLIAPLCANALAGAALGLCGNLLGSVLRAWYYDLDPEFAAPIAERCGAHVIAKPVLVAPAMNTFMWHQRITGQHLATLEARGVRVAPPIAKRLACGDMGMGAMAEVPDVVRAALELLEAHLAAEERALAEGKQRFEL